MIIDSYTVTCPQCGFKGGEKTDFHMSFADECFCPKCELDFILERIDEDEEEE